MQPAQMLEAALDDVFDSIRGDEDAFALLFESILLGALRVELLNTRSEMSEETWNRRRAQSSSS